MKEIIIVKRAFAPYIGMHVDPSLIVVWCSIKDAAFSEASRRDVSAALAMSDP
jgi:hypothetical protein